MQVTASASPLETVTGHHLGTQVSRYFSERSLDSGRAAQFNVRDNPHLDHGYAVTSHSSQGATADRVLVHVDTEAAHEKLINSRLAYVSVSRARYDAQIYTNDAADLGRALSRDTSHTAAIEPQQSAAASNEMAQDNGQITQAIDTISGETISYQYDSLKRLVSATSVPNSGSTATAWTQTYQYDGFGNLTAKVLNGTSTPITVNTATNQLSNAIYDANGNMTSGLGATFSYDTANRITGAFTSSGGAETYDYSPQNKRVYQYKYTTGYYPYLQELFTLYGAKGEKLGDYTLSATDGSGTEPPGGVYTFSPASLNIWFAGILVSDAGNNTVLQDRVGTNRANGARFLPFGEEITSTANDHVKFATYTRDSYTTLDYANQRYYASTYGRFNTPDPYRATTKAVDNPNNPGSWNRYAYALGDPVNLFDPMGTAACSPLILALEDCDDDSDFNEASTCGAGLPDGATTCHTLGDFSYGSVTGDCVALNGSTNVVVSPASTPAQTCGQVNPDGTSAEQTELAVLFGEDSWSSGYSPSAVGQEDSLMINVMVNQTIQSRGGQDSQSSVASYINKYSTSRFLGFASGQNNLAIAVGSSVGSNACQHLITAESAFSQFWGAGGTPFSPYNQWRSNGTIPTQGLILQTAVVAGTTFFNIIPTPPFRPLPPRSAP